MSRDEGQRGWTPPWWVGLVRATGHLLAVLVVASLLALWLTTGPARATIWRGLSDGLLLEPTLLRGALHLGLSALVWAGLYGGWRTFTHRRQERLSSRRGAVMLETAIVLPVALLLIMGLAQFAVINIAQTLTNFAAYEAARAAWVWEGERGANRAGASISTNDVEEYARLQAAMVITPAAPGAFRQGWDLSDRGLKTRGMLVGAQIPVPFEDSGQQGIQLARELRSRSLGDVPRAGNSSFALAFDPSNNLLKTVRKFTWAYQATDVRIDDDSSDDQLAVELTYYHYCAFPIVAGLFGDRFAQGGRAGYFRKMTRTITRRRQRPADQKWPHWQSGDIDRSIEYF